MVGVVSLKLRHTHTREYPNIFSVMYSNCVKQLKFKFVFSLPNRFLLMLCVMLSPANQTLASIEHLT